MRLEFDFFIYIVFRRREMIIRIYFERVNYFEIFFEFYKMVIDLNCISVVGFLYEEKKEWVNDSRFIKRNMIINNNYVLLSRNKSFC